MALIPTPHGLPRRLPFSFIYSTIDLVWIELDVVSEIHPKMEGTVSEHPIEGGEIVVDHVFNRPTEIKLNGVIAGPHAPQALATLQRWMNENHLVHYYGRPHAFREYIIKEFTTSHDVQIGDGFRFAMDLHQLKIIRPAPHPLFGADPGSNPGGVQTVISQARTIIDKGRQQMVIR